jgi:hypothetical protein
MVEIVSRRLCDLEGRDPNDWPARTKDALHLIDAMSQVSPGMIQGARQTAAFNEDTDGDVIATALRWGIRGAVVEWREATGDLFDARPMPNFIQSAPRGLFARFRRHLRLV